jgi:uncharacterized protein (DUF2342 family)
VGTGAESLSIAAPHCQSAVERRIVTAADTQQLAAQVCNSPRAPQLLFLKRWQLRSAAHYRLKVNPMNDETNQSSSLGIYIALGAGIGAALGAAAGAVIGNVAMGVAFGPAVGVGIGIALWAATRKGD